MLNININVHGGCKWNNKKLCGSESPLVRSLFVHVHLPACFMYSSESINNCMDMLVKEDVYLRNGRITRFPILLNCFVSHFVVAVVLLLLPAIIIIDSIVSHACKHFMEMLLNETIPCEISTFKVIEPYINIWNVCISVVLAKMVGLIMIMHLLNLYVHIFN